MELLYPSYQYCYHHRHHHHFRRNEKLRHNFLRSAIQGRQGRLNCSMQSKQLSNPQSEIHCLPFPRILWCILCYLNPVSRKIRFPSLAQKLEVIVRNELRKSWSSTRIYCSSDKTGPLVSVLSFLLFISSSPCSNPIDTRPASGYHISLLFADPTLRV
jgi:hypothetical protein